MDVLRERSAGLDVHRSVIVACVLLSTLGSQVTKEVKHFTATAAGLAELVAWLGGYGVTHVGMEGTGVYWMPVYAALTGFAFFAAMGLPGLSAFISEVLVLIGAWQRYPVMTVLGAGTAILTAGYMLWTFQRIYLGPLNEIYKGLPDLTLREAFTLVPLAIIVLILGVYPHAILDLLGASLNHVNHVVLMAHAPAAAMAH